MTEKDLEIQELRRENARLRENAAVAARLIRRLKVETGSLVCLGCGEEHGRGAYTCGIHGCARITKALEVLDEKDHI